MSSNRPEKKEIMQYDKATFLSNHKDSQVFFDSLANESHFTQFLREHKFVEEHCDLLSLVIYPNYNSLSFLHSSTYPSITKYVFENCRINDLKLSVLEITYFRGMLATLFMAGIDRFAIDDFIEDGHLIHDDEHYSRWENSIYRGFYYKKKKNIPSENYYYLINSSLESFLIAYQNKILLYQLKLY